MFIFNSMEPSTNSLIPATKLNEQEKQFQQSLIWLNSPFTSHMYF